MQNKSKLKIWLPLILAVTFAAGLSLGWFMNRPEELTPGEKKLRELFAIISEDYVDPVDLDSLIERSIPGILANLDPHSAYISLADKAMPDELDGSFSGIGIQFQLFNDTVCVVEAMSGGPAEKVGIMSGDRIVSVDGKNIASINISNEDVFKLLRGKKNTKVTLGIRRPGSPKVVNFTVKRGDIPVTSIDAAYMVSPTVGYVKINKFARNTYAEFLQSMTSLTNRGARDFIIDLRGNTGGYMEPAIMIVNEFLPARCKIVSTKGRHPQDNSVVISDGSGSFPNARVAVLTDENTASASEIFSGAIQDNDRGLIIGRRSFGKGLVQRPIQLKDGSEIRLTVQRYYTPSGRSIQKDYTPGRNDQYEYEIFERYRNGEMQSADSVKFDKKLLFKTATGRQVYGGGGIMPDIFMPNDTTAYTGYFVSAFNQGLFQKFAYEYCDLNRADLEKAKNVNELLKLLPPDNILLNAFVQYAVTQGLPARWYYINISQGLIVKQVKALIARDILGIPAYYEINNSDDSNVIRALREIIGGNANFPIKP